MSHRRRGVAGRRPACRVWCAAAFAGVLLLFGPLAAHALSIADYRSLVVGAAATLAQLPEDDADRPGRGSRRGGAHGGGRRRGGATRRRHVRPTNPPLRAALAAGDVARVQRQLEALADALERAAAGRAAAPDAERQLADILARPEFRPPTPNPLDRWLQPLREQVERLWRRLLYWLSAQGDSPVHPLWIGVAVLIVAAVVAVLVGAFGGNVVAGARVVAAGPPGGRATGTSRAHAEALAASGDYRAAVHELYLATLLHLDERQSLRFRPSLTNREHLLRGEVTARVSPRRWARWSRATTASGIAAPPARRTSGSVSARSLMPPGMRREDLAAPASSWGGSSWPSCSPRRCSPPPPPTTCPSCPCTRARRTGGALCGSGWRRSATRSRSWTRTRTPYLTAPPRCSCCSPAAASTARPWRDVEASVDGGGQLVIASPGVARGGSLIPSAWLCIHRRATRRPRWCSRSSPRATYPARARGRLGGARGARWRWRRGSPPRRTSTQARAPSGRGASSTRSARHYPLTNPGLRDSDNAALVINLLGQLPPGARPWPSTSTTTASCDAARAACGDLLLENPWGWAALYGVALAYLYLVWSGRRFGRPLAPLGAPRRTVGELRGLPRRRSTGGLASVPTPPTDWPISSSTRWPRRWASAAPHGCRLRGGRRRAAAGRSRVPGARAGAAPRWRSPPRKASC